MVEYLQARGGDSVDNMQWNLVVKPDATVDRFIYQISASLKSMENKTISDRFNSFALAIADNRPNITERYGRKTNITTVKTVFRKKPKIFAFRDHSSTGELVDIGVDAIQAAKKTAPRIQAPKERARIMREIKLQKVQHVANLPGMESFQAADRNHVPHPHHTMLGFINQNASEDVSADNQIIVDWHVPIRMRLILLPDEIT